MASSLLLIGVLGSSSGNKPRGKPGWSQPPIGTAYINGMASRGIQTVHVRVAGDIYATGDVIGAAKRICASTCHLRPRVCGSPKYLDTDPVVVVEAAFLV
jgi:hypothetical protein